MMKVWVGTTDKLETFDENNTMAVKHFSQKVECQYPVDNYKIINANYVETSNEDTIS